MNKGVICLQGGYANPLTQIEVLDLSKYNWLTFCFVWDEAQIHDVKTLTYSDFVNIAIGGVLYLYNNDGSQSIEVRYVDNTHIKINCTSSFVKLRIYGNMAV